MRVARAVRERVSPLPNEPPDATWRRHYAQHAPLPTVQRIADTLAPRPQAVSAAERERLLQEADALLRGAWTLFGYPATGRPALLAAQLPAWQGLDGRPREGD